MANQLPLGAAAPISDLFPETLLVSREGGRVFTTSRKVAEHFGKRHKNVLRDVEKLLAELPDVAFSRLNFEPRNYSYQTGKGQRAAVAGLSRAIYTCTGLV